LIVLVAGTRPNFVKIAPIQRALAQRGCKALILHTGQHFDAAMSEVFFHDLDLPPPDVHLHAGGGSHAEQTAAVLVGVEAHLAAHRPALVVVVGDVTSTLAASLAAAKLGIPVAHVEAGLRARDWTMPEEINRVLTDQLSDLLLTPSRDATPNLLAEGIARERIVFVGNVMIDSMRYALERRACRGDAGASGDGAAARLGLEPLSYAVATLHRPANVDSRDHFEATLDALAVIAGKIPLIFPMHPRTLERARALGQARRLEEIAGLHVAPPLGYDDFLELMAGARLVATDSGGIQEETTALGIPCLTLRGGTERPITVAEGTNTVVGLDAAYIDQEVTAILEGQGKRGRVPEGWDGRAGERIADALLAFLAGAPPPKTAGPRA
jgi:UDP-N-acetylglucosamine 2-epimerase (non-hydrolysing)